MKYKREYYETDRQGFRIDKLFNVDVDGARVATCVTRAEAETYLVARRATGGSCYVYLSERPIVGRRAAWSKARIPRLPSMRVSAAERQKLTDALLLDGTLQCDESEALAA